MTVTLNIGEVAYNTFKRYAATRNGLTAESIMEMVLDSIGGDDSSAAIYRVEEIHKYYSPEESAAIIAAQQKALDEAIENIGKDFLERLNKKGEE